jgi:putative DNA primase/helicase
MALNTALIKQLTGGDTYTARFLHENPVEFLPQFKIFMNTNHLPHAEDDTVFTSGRVKLIPFDRHFEAGEQDKGLKKLFSQGKNKSGILNWLLRGYQLLQAEGLDD